MNRSFSKIRHIQEANRKLEERRVSLLTEQVDISKYEGSKTNPMDDSELDMSNIKVTKDQGEVEKKPLSPADSLYKKIKDFFELEYDVEVLGIMEPVNKSVSPLVYEVHFPSTNPNEKFKIFEFTIEDIDTNNANFAKRLNILLPSIKNTTLKNNQPAKPEKTFRA